MGQVSPISATPNFSCAKLDFEVGSLDVLPDVRGSMLPDCRTDPTLTDGISQIVDGMYPNIEPCIYSH